MQGLEVALVRLATTVAGTVAKSLLAPRQGPGAGLVPKPAQTLPGRTLPGRPPGQNCSGCAAPTWSSR